MNKKIYLSPPNIGEEEMSMVHDALKGNWIAPVGPDLSDFENEIKEYLDVKYSCALSSGTAAIHMALKVLNIKKGDTVLCPTLTFVATVNPVIYENAIPVFIDVNNIDWTADINALEEAIKLYKPKVFISVDLYGQPCNYDMIKQICEKYKIIMIEDAAEALGSKYKSKKCGTLAHIGILSFNGNKIITTSGGGMLMSDNEEYVKKALFLASQAREPFLHYEHKEIGYNYRLSNILASIGRAQLKKINSFVNKKRQIFRIYQEAFKEIEGFKFQEEPFGSKSNRWLTAVRINKYILGFDKEHIIKHLLKENIESRPIWKPMHLQPLYKNFNYVYTSKVSNSDTIYNEGICLPSGSNLSQLDQERVINLILDLFS